MFPVWFRDPSWLVWEEVEQVTVWGVGLIKKRPACCRTALPAYRPVLKQAVFHTPVLYCPVGVSQSQLRGRMCMRQFCV